MQIFLGFSDKNQQRKKGEDPKTDKKGNNCVFLLKNSASNPDLL